MVSGPDSEKSVYRTAAARRRMSPLFFVLLHVPLGLLIGLTGAMGATIWALGSAVLVVVTALTSSSIRSVVTVTIYAAASDVLWRASGAHFFWEGGKYLLIIGMTLVILRLAKSYRRAALPLAYLAALIPSAVLSLVFFGISGFRQPVADALTGPFALGITALCFLQLKVQWSEYHRLMSMIVAPTVALGGFILTKIAHSGGIRYSANSNYITSGGFGPNEVSDALSLGALVAFILAFHNAPRTRQRWIWGFISLWLIIQSIFTFSRGGLYSAGAGILIILAYQLRHGPSGRVLIAVTLLVVAAVPVLQSLNSTTHGTLSQRFTSTNKFSDGRTAIASSDLLLFQTHPLAGVGPGVAQQMRGPNEDQRGSPPHTEFTRLLAEHGSLGLAAAVCLLAMVALAFRRTPNWISRAPTLALGGWSLTTMLHSDMRIADIALAFALAMLEIKATAQGPPPLTGARKPSVAHEMAGQLGRCRDVGNDSSVTD